jgi:hypothetical protein
MRLPCPDYLYTLFNIKFAYGQHYVGSPENSTV